LQEEEKSSTLIYIIYTQKHILVNAVYHIKNLTRRAKYGAQQSTTRNMFKCDEDCASGTPFADRTISARACSPGALAVGLDHGEIKGEFLRQMASENELKLAHC
jgi:hypothetical protein